MIRTQRILVDTSIWVELIEGRAAAPLDTLILERFVICGPVLQEVLQGAKPSAVRFLMDRLDGLPRLSDPLPERLFWEAAEIFRLGRQKGITIRSGFDCLIAAIAIENDVPIWHRDRDYLNIARYTKLRQVRDAGDAANA